MGVTVERKGDYLKVESDVESAGSTHAMIHDDRELRTAMEVSGINKIEVKMDDPCEYNVRAAFDDKYKEKSGHKWFGF